MPSFSLSCSVEQGFNFRKDVSTPVGFITALKIGAGKALAADVVCKDPMKPGDDLKVVSVVSQVSWGVGVTDSIYLAGQISAPNRQAVSMLAYLDLTNVQVLFKFRMYNYDPVAKKYYQCFHIKDDAELKGILEKNGDDLNVRVADEPSKKIQSPINYSFQIGIKPEPVSQNLAIATADKQNVVKAWGLKVG